jgi:recombination protein RecR
MSNLPKSIQKLINEFGKLPGIGPKTASRLTFFLLKNPEIDLQVFSDAITNLRKDLLFCSVCYNMAETNPCPICADTKRDHNVICVVEDALDVVALDQISDYNGVFHVLGGVISPLDGMGPGNLKIAELFERIQKTNPNEIVLATNPSLEGEATAMYIAKRLKQNFPQIKVTRLARGLPSGADLEYADEFTLSKALEGRREY